jgi:DNA-binding NtrC family response regulator/serine/threonine protein kinase
MSDWLHGEIVPSDASESGWQFERLIHVSRQANVYRVVNAAGVVGAMKMLRGPSNGAAADTRMRLESEVAALKALTHDHLPRLLDHGATKQGTPWLVTEWLIGWDLETHRQRLGGRLPAFELISVGLQLLDLLSFVHEHGYVHQDIKPANLFLVERGDLHLLDFGTCRELAASRRYGQRSRTGTPGFMAPEHKQVGATIDQRADLWSVGSTLFLLATGRPLERASPNDPQGRSLSLLAPELPPELVRVIEQALELRVDLRWQDAGSMRLALARCAASATDSRRAVSAEPDWEAGRVTTDLLEQSSVCASEPRELRLQIVSSPDQAAKREQSFTRGAALTIGRSADWRVADSRISNHHARIEWRAAEDHCVVVDLSSTNGVRVNGVRRQRHVLCAGDVLRIGKTVLVVDGSGASDLDAATERAARSTATVLITGQTGVGKEVLARRIHAASGRTGEFVAINCGALPPQLAASELFGHTRGAFSGATGARRGAFQTAVGGTLMLDEVGELPLDLQPLLLRALQQRAIRPVGADREQAIDVRVIAATNIRPESCVEAGSFRGDLYARLAQLSIEISPLCERRQQIPQLLGCFAAALGRELSPSADAMEALLLWTWPFNVRELENLVQAWASLAPVGPELSLTQLRTLVPKLVAHYEEFAEAPTTIPPPPSVSKVCFETLSYDSTPLQRALTSCRGNISETAKLLGTSRTQVYRWMSRFGLKSRGQAARSLP